MRNKTIWVLTGLYAIFALGKLALRGTPLDFLVPIVTIVVPVIFVLLHGTKAIGTRRLVIFFLLTFAISWTYESLSITTGFPFGHYHYTDLLGPKLGTVPLLIMPAYFGMCYVSLLIARLLLGNGRGGKQPAGLVATVLVASFVMVMWDLSMDPLRATVSGTWVWHQGGAYFGVPLVNFAGWYLCVATIFAAYLLVERRVSDGGARVDRTASGQALALYAATFAEFVTPIFWTPSGTAIDGAGQVWNQGDIYQSLGLVAIFTMGFVVLLGWNALAGSVNE